MDQKKKRLEARRTLIEQWVAASRKDAYRTPLLPATTPEGRATWHTAAMAAAIRCAQTGNNDVLPTRVDDLTPEEREQLSQAYADVTSISKDGQAVTLEEAWAATRAPYLDEARRAFFSCKAIKEFAGTYLAQVDVSTCQAIARWFTQEITHQRQQGAIDSTKAAPQLTTYVMVGGCVVVDPGKMFPPDEGEAPSVRSALIEALKRYTSTLTKTNALLLANDHFIGEVAPANIIKNATGPHDLTNGRILVLEKDEGDADQAKGSGGDARPKKSRKERELASIALFDYHDPAQEVETPWERAACLFEGIFQEAKVERILEEADAAAGKDTPSAHRAAERAAEFDKAWGDICTKYGRAYMPPDPTAPKRFAAIATMARKAISPFSSALMHHAPMEHFYHRAADYVEALHTMRPASADRFAGSDYGTADFLTMVNGLMSLLSKQSQAAGTLTFDPALGPLMNGWDIVAIKEGEKIRIISASPVLSFTAPQLIKEGRGGTPQKRDIDRMHRLLRELSTFNRDTAETAGLHKAIINNVTGEEDICKDDPVTGGKNYYLTLTNYFLSEQRYLRVIDSWDSYLDAKRSAKGLGTKANTYVTEADMRFVFFLRTLRPGAPFSISSDALAERIGKEERLRHNPAIFRTEIAAMAEAAKTMTPPLLEQYEVSKGAYIFTTIEQKPVALPTPPQPKLLPAASSSAAPPKGKPKGKKR